MGSQVSRLRSEGFIFGLSFSAAMWIIWKVSIDKKHFLVCDDQSNSLFYGENIANGGRGFPYAGNLVDVPIKQLTTVHPEYKRLPIDLYKAAVENLPIVCVDVICRRNKDQKILLFYRKDKPAASIWWWPGGRLLKGETFFAAAVRKIREETGNPTADVVPIGIINVWNTFFPDSNWDEGRLPGREGTQTVNITVFCELRGDDELLVKQGDKSDWAVESVNWISHKDALVIGSYDKYVRLNVEQAIQLGFL